MKYTGVIIGVFATICVALLAILSAVHCTFSIAVFFALMAIISSYMTYIELKNIED